MNRRRFFTGLAAGAATMALSQKTEATGKISDEEFEAGVRQLATRAGINYWTIWRGEKGGWYAHYEFSAEALEQMDCFVQIRQVNKKTGKSFVEERQVGKETGLRH